MTSSHKHSTTGKLAVAGDIDTALAALDARVKKLEAAVPPPPTTLPGWKQVFDDQYTTWDPSKYFVYPAWSNGFTSVYDPTAISSDGSKLRIFIHTDSTGTPRTAAFCPLPTGSLSGRGDLPSMRVEFRLRADKMPGYKGVPLLWPMSGNWPMDGEIDGPEGNFDALPKCFMHYQGAYKDATGKMYGPGGTTTYQDSFTYPTGWSWQDWHTYVTEWVSGTSVKYFGDGALIGQSTKYIPNTPMHLVMQFESQLNSTKPDPLTQGYVEIDYLKVWVPG